MSTDKFTDLIGGGDPWGHRPPVADQANLNIPFASVRLDAFNLIVGAAFMVYDEPDPRVWIVEKVYRDGDFEDVSIWAHDATNNEHLGNEKAFLFGYCSKVALIGLVINPEDPDDNNWGR